MSAESPLSGFSKLRRILGFPFGLGRRLQALELNATQIRGEHQQLAGDQAQLRRDHDAAVAWLQSTHGEIVSAIGKKIDVEHFDQLTQQQAQLTGDLAQLRRDHDASVAWLQSTYPEIASAIGKKIEPEQFDQLTQDVFAALHREIGALRDRFIALENAALPSAQALVPASQADSRGTGFYLELERRFRGTAAEISARAQPYLELLQTNPAAHSPVLDIGCGRGEWLTLLAGQHLPASGIDLNPINGDYCRSRGLDVHTGDALAHLAALPANSLGTVTAFHLVEHLPFSMLLALTDEILRVLKPGGLLIYETPNPENLLVATQSFWLDPTHLRPLPPDLLEFLVLQRGFGQAEVRRLHEGERSPTGDATLQALLSGPRDYAVLARKANQAE